MKRGLSVFLSASMLLCSLAVFPAGGPAAVSAAEPDSRPTLTVDMAPDEERELKHGASGWLYGLGDEGVPTANTMTPLKPHTAVQKAPNGMQHPNGDVLDVADTFLDAGGEDLQIYVPDYYALWFYEFSSTQEYLEILRMQAEECIEKGIEDEVVYVLYNEPNENWIGGSYTDPETETVSYGWDSLFWFWEDMYDLVVEVYEEHGVESKPRFAGLNLAAYNENVMHDYIQFCVEHNCMPDVVTWHDLGTWNFDNFGNEYNHYRSLEEQYLTPENAERYGVDITPREIVINEYAANYECSSPGDLVRWIGLFEEYNVAGCLPFWHLSNNLNGLAASNNEGNGAWWLFKWYGDMSGQYLPVTTSNTEKNNYYGAASLDENKRSANVIFGGVDGSSNIVLENITDTETFQDADLVHVKLEATDYTGFHGAAEEPRVVKEGAVQVVDGDVVIPISDMMEMSAYHLTITQAGEDEIPGFLSSTWKEMYEAEDGSFAGGAGIGSIDGAFAGSGRQKVIVLNSTSGAVDIQVSVPTDGYYKYDMVYMTGSGCNTADPENNTPYTAIQNLYVDGQMAEEMQLSTTLNWNMGGMYSTYLYLSEGTHTIRIQGTDSVRFADVDCIYLTYKGQNESDLEFNKTYQAELGEFNELLGSSTPLTTQREGNVDYVAGLNEASVTDGAGLRFTVIVPEDGMHTLDLRYSSDQAGSINIYQDNDAVNLDNHTAAAAVENTEGAWADTYQTVFLQKGINIIDLDADTAVRLDSLTVRTADVAASAVVEAESGTLTGEAALGSDSNVIRFASENGYVAGIKAANGVEVIEPDDPDFEIYGRGRAVDLGEAVDKNSLTITVTVPEAGDYKMAVYQSSGELFGQHAYNAQMTERYASFSVNGGGAQKVVFRNSYSDETFCSQVVPVTLEAGENTIKIYNDNSKVITNGIHQGGDRIPANIDYNVLVNYTPNFDKFVFYPTVAETEVTEAASYQVTASATEGGRVSYDQSRVEAGGTVSLTFSPERNMVLTEATVNGESIMDQLSQSGGVYILTDVQSDVAVNAYFEPGTSSDYIYSVNCGDIDPSTLSEGELFGTNNSVTDQFYGEDPGTGKMWGVVDRAVSDLNFPGWLTGEKTWPCENAGVTDESPRTESFRYARNQATTDVGIVYQFELEPDTEYTLELGFYVPAGWTNAEFPRTMKLVLNDTDVVNDNFTASTDFNEPFVIRTTGTSDADGNLKVQIGHADNAVWGPVVSYIDIMASVDKTELQNTYDEFKDAEQGLTSDEDWNAFRNALENAKFALDSDRFGAEELAGLVQRLEAAAENLRQLDHIEITSLPNTTEYQVGDAFDATGLEVEAVDDKGGRHPLSPEDYTLSGHELNSTGTVEITVSYQGETDVFEVTVSEQTEPDVVLKSLEITKKGKTEYAIGEAFSKEGMEVTVYYTDGSSKTVSDYEVGEFDSAAPGSKKVLISYTEEGITVSAWLEVTVVSSSQNPQEPGAGEDATEPGGPKPDKADKEEGAVQTGDAPVPIAVYVFLAAAGAGTAGFILRKRYK